MSDFFSSGWSIFVGVATVLGLLACLWLLFIAAKRQPMAADNSTGHVFDEDLVEMNNPLPRWWLILFVLTVLFSFGYVAVFPGLGSLPGGGHERGHAQRRQLCVELVGQCAQLDRCVGRAGQVRCLRGVPRCGRQGQPGSGRTQPQRQDLAARLG